MKRSIAISILAVILLLNTVVMAFGLLSAPSEQDFLFNGILYVGLWLYWGLGTLIVARGDGHLVGWLFTVSAAMVASVMSCFLIGFQLTTSQPSNPLGAWLGLVGYLLVTPAVILALPAVALTFPTGTLPGPRWRWPVRLVVAMTALQVLAVMMRPGPLFDDGGPINPLTPWLPAVSPGVVEILRLLEAFGGLALPLGAALGIAAIAVRFRRSQGDQRQQLKWFLAAITPAAVLIPLSLSGVADSLWFVDPLSVATLPIIALSVAVAILRYRLYDIDLVIRRTLVYGALVAILGAVYVALVLALQSVLSGVTGGETLPVALSTLVIAALFGPARARVREAVDRRFYRSRYDAQRTLEQFAGQLRDQVELEAVGRSLVDVAGQAVRPAAIGIWVRDQAS